MPYKPAILANAVTVTASGAEATYIPRFPEPVQAATFTLTITTASGSLTAIIQRGRPNIATGDTIYSSSTTFTYEDYIAFSTTTTAGTQKQYITIYTTTAKTVQIPTSGVLTAGGWVGPPIGPGPFRLFYVPSGVSPSFTLSCLAELEFAR